MTPQETINKLNSLKQYYNDKNEDGYVGFDNEDNEAITMAIQALEQQPCEDCISRQAVLDKKELVELEDGQSFYCINPKVIETLPSVIPQPKRGHWIVIRKEYEFMGSVVNEAQGCKCSNCDGIVKLKSDYCPNCGADMRGER